MKTSKYKRYFFIFCGVLLFSSYSFAQNFSKKTTAISINNSSTQSQQVWSMELRATSNSLFAFIDNWHSVNASANLNCSFSIAYDNGQSYHTGAVAYVFRYYLFKNNVEIDSYEEVVDISNINDYVAFHTFSNIVNVNNNDIVSGGMKIFYIYYDQYGNSVYVQILPSNTTQKYEPTPNSIKFTFNEPNVGVNSLFKPQCPNIASPTYYHVIQAKDLILLTPGFSVNSDDMEFKAEIISSKNTNVSVTDNIHNVFFNNHLKNDNYQSKEKFIKVYPNPSSGRFTVENIFSDPLHILYYNGNGIKINEIDLDVGETYTVNYSSRNYKFINLIIYSKNNLLTKKTVIIKN